MLGARMRSRAHRAGEAAAAIQLANDRPAFGQEAPATRKLIVTVYDFRIDAERLREPSDPALQQRAEQNSGAEDPRSEEHTSELQSRRDLVCRLLLEKKK